MNERTHMKDLSREKGRSNKYSIQFEIFIRLFKNRITAETLLVYCLSWQGMPVEESNCRDVQRRKINETENRFVLHGLKEFFRQTSSLMEKM